MMGTNVMSVQYSNIKTTSFMVSYNTTDFPTSVPTSRPTSEPSSQPSSQPSLQPITVPTLQPSLQPSLQPIMVPSLQPSSQPSLQPSSQPTSQSSLQPSSQPTLFPTMQPYSQPSSRPTLFPTMQPTIKPTIMSRIPSIYSSYNPSLLPSPMPEVSPSSAPVFPSTIVPTINYKKYNISTHNPSFNSTNTIKINTTYYPSLELNSKSNEETIMPEEIALYLTSTISILFILTIFWNCYRIKNEKNKFSLLSNKVSDIKDIKLQNSLQNSNKVSPQPSECSVNSEININLRNIDLESTDSDN